MKCEAEDCECYPVYGVAPHTHDLSGGNWFGSTALEPRSTWPKHFVEDPDCQGLGTYYCPKCLEGLPDAN